jgi:hypothetical protein
MQRPRHTRQRTLFVKSVGPSIQERFLVFHKDHPEVYAACVRFAREAKARGFQHFGIRVIWERARWYLTIERTDGDYKLNDHYHSRYARLIMQQEPDLADFFETRELQAD